MLVDGLFRNVRKFELPSLPDLNVGTRMQKGLQTLQVLIDK
jgi:hypothetical protein